VRWKKAALESCPGVPCVTALACGSVSSVSDYDGNTYTTVSIGDQCWTVENLRVRKYNDGTPIPFDNTGLSVGTSASWQNLTIGAHTLYAHDSTATPSNLNNYGYLYNWYAAAGIVTNLGSPTKNICPTGWHVPSDREWTLLIQFIDPTAGASFIGTQSTIAGSKMKSTSTLWNIASPISPGTDNYGFTALPGGYRDFDGDFFNIGEIALFWSATEYDSNYAWYRDLYHAYPDVGRDNNDEKTVGGSVRCLRD